MVVKWIRILYLIIAWLFPLAILVQVLSRRSQPLYKPALLGRTYLARSHDRYSANPPGHSRIPGTAPTTDDHSHLARVRNLYCPGRSLCGHPRRRSAFCCVPPGAGSRALCSCHDHCIAGANGGACGCSNVFHFAESAFHGKERIFGSRLNQERQPWKTWISKEATWRIGPFNATVVLPYLYCTLHSGMNLTIVMQ